MIVECAEKFDPDSTIYLVGSQAIDQTSLTSDIDILIISNIKEKLAKNLRKNLRCVNSKLHSYISVFKDISTPL